MENIDIHVRLQRFNYNFLHFVLSLSSYPFKGWELIVPLKSFHGCSYTL